MRARGAVDLSLSGTLVGQPTLTRDPLRDLSTRINDLREQGDHVAAARLRVWREEQLSYLFGASVLLAHLRSVAEAPLAYFDVARDPDALTLGQLAALRGANHPGVAGQSFEFAVADAVNSGVSAVVDPIRNALDLLGVDAAQPVSMILCGIEKRAQTTSRHVMESIRELVPKDATLRTGLRGRPVGRDTALDRIAQQTWETMARAPDDSSGHDPGLAPGATYEQTSQLARADAWVIAGSAIVPASLKINSSHVPRYGWRDVPLWITTGARTMRVRTSTVPRVVASLNRHFGPEQVFLGVVQAMDRVLADVRLRRRSGATYHARETALWSVMRRHIDQPVAVAARALRDAAHEPLAEQLNIDLPVASGDVVVPVLDNPSITNGFRQEVRDHGLLVLHKQLWSPLSGAV